MSREYREVRPKRCRDLRQIRMRAIDRASHRKEIGRRMNEAYMILAVTVKVK